MIIQWHFSRYDNYHIVNRGRGMNDDTYRGTLMNVSLTDEILSRKFVDKLTY